MVACAGIIGKTNLQSGQTDFDASRWGSTNWLACGCRIFANIELFGTSLRRCVGGVLDREISRTRRYLSWHRSKPLIINLKLNILSIKGIDSVSIEE
jgi:hypothetical protein